jgi:diguanylate cyclase (GGDEF)-like protein/PAS domain S-box-containing protein
MSLRSSSDATLRATDIAAMPAPLQGELQDLIKNNGGTLLELADLLNDSVIVVDGRNLVIYLNRAAERLFGFRRSAVMGRPILRLIAQATHGDARPGHAVALMEAQGVRKDGTVFSLEGTVTALKQTTDCCRVYVVRDATDGGGAVESAKLASLVYHNTSEGMLVMDSTGIILDVNPAFVRLRGYVPAEAVGRHIRSLNSAHHDRDFYRAIWRAVMNNGSWQGEHWGQHKNGEVYPEWLSINTILKKDGTVFRRVMIFSNITEIKRAEAIIWKQANFDRLTELPNRQMFHLRLDQSIKKAQDHGSKFALMFLDLDRFKEINDTLGHAMGDILLKQAARRLSLCVRQSDTVARLGGDEFTVLLDDLRETSDALKVARSILHRMSEPFLLGMETVYISTSIGITFYPDDSTSIETLLNNADQAMYVAKRQGRNRYSYFTPSMQEEAQTRMRLANDLHIALMNDEFSLEYQPIVDLATGAVVKAEALLRWHHPQRGLVPPEEFIPLAEETGLVTSIGDWVFRAAVRQAAYWRQAYTPDFQISVNTSPVQFRNEGIDLSSWLNCLREEGVPGSGLVIEITEGILLDANAANNDQLAAFRQAGIQVSLDDFGTGYSSLSYLRKFNIDYLKIDQSFISNLDTSANDRALCETIIVMAHKLGLKVVAEGVETQEQYDVLMSAGCDYGQGYLFSRPVPPQQFEMLLTQTLN